MRGEKTTSTEQHVRTLRAWHLALLRFALTLEESDRQQVIAAAREIDQTGLSCGGRQDFRYFRTLSEELCRAMAEPNATPSPLLCSYMGKIENARIKRAFAAAVGLDGRLSAVGKTSKSDMLWRGLSPRSTSGAASGFRRG